VELQFRTKLCAGETATGEFREQAELDGREQDFGMPKAVCRIDEGSRAAFIGVRFWLTVVMGHNLAYLNEFDNCQGGMVRGSLTCEYTDPCSGVWPTHLRKIGELTLNSKNCHWPDGD
jgi:hypothetical protein